MPKILKISWGRGWPSNRYSPFLIFSPWLKLICLPLGIKYDEDVPSTLTIDTFCFPLSSLPNSIAPLFSAIIALSFAFLASNNSATRGNPPVISFVLVVSFGSLAIISPANIFWPSLTERIESGTN